MSIKPVLVTEPRVRRMAEAAGQPKRTEQPVVRAKKNVNDAFVGTTRSAAAAATTGVGRSDVEALVTDAYRTYLRREPEAGGFARWADAAMGLSQLGSSKTDIAAHLRRQFEGSAEFGALQLVDRTFAQELGRDISGSRGFWHEEAVRLRRDEGMPAAELDGWLRASFRNSPEYKHGHVDETVNAAFLKMLSRPVGQPGYWNDEAHRMIDGGASLQEVRTHLEVSISQSDEYRHNAAGQLVDGAFHSVLGRSGGSSGYWHDQAFQMLKEGHSEASVSTHLELSLRGSDEYALGHLNEVVGGKYREHLGRDGDASGIAGWTSFAEQLRDQGQSAPQIRAALDEGFRGSDEYKTLQAPKQTRLDRSELYLQQPNGWTCAPTSLTMALADFGLRPASLDTMWDLAAQTGTAAGVGLPGNASLLANAARSNGLQAEYSGSRSADDIRAQLEQGRGVIVNGSIGTVGHFLYLTGIDPQGLYIVADPFRPGITRWNDAQLNDFTHSGVNPPGFAAVWR